MYISGRPFVLRDATEPRRVLKLSDRAENLEAIEQRLAADIFAESAKYVERPPPYLITTNICRYGGLLLTHNEVAVDDSDGTILPTWTAIDSNNVKTPRELFESMRKSGWNVEVIVTTNSATHTLISVSITGKSPQYTVEPAS